MKAVTLLYSLIIGILLAEFHCPTISLALGSIAVVGWVYAEKYRVCALFVALVALVNLLALQDKTSSAMMARAEEKENAPLAYLSQRIDNLQMSQQSKALAHGMLLGKKDSIDKKQKQNLRNAGMSHIIAVSGLHVGIIYLLLFWLMAPFRLFLPFRWQCIIIIAGVWLYVYVIGCPVSAVRAALLFSFIESHKFLAINTSKIHLLARVGVIMLLYDTQQLWDVGFQLSFLATFGILKANSHFLGPKIDGIYRLFMMTVAAQISTAPIVAYYFHSVPIFGWVQGLLVIPVLSVFVYLIVLYLLLPIFHFLAYPIEAISDWIFFVSDFVTKAEFWWLGGNLRWYPSVIETCFLQAACIALIFILFPYGREHAARRKNILPL